MSWIFQVELEKKKKQGFAFGGVVMVMVVHRLR